jgi:hypothetical protein
MTIGLLFCLVSLSALVASVLVVLLLRRQLRRILVDVCEGEHRAEFWVALSGVWIVLMGLLAGTATLGYWNADGSVNLFGGATSQVRLLLLGLLGAVLTIAAVLLYVIRRRSQPVPSVWPGPPPRAASPYAHGPIAPPVA